MKFFLKLILLFTLSAYLGKSCISEINLLDAINIPFDTSFIDYVSGIDNFPAFLIKKGAFIQKPYRLIFPEVFYTNFSIVVTLKLIGSGGFLFSSNYLLFS
jgi:hypothetical protein